MWTQHNTAALGENGASRAPSPPHPTTWESSSLPPVSGPAPGQPGWGALGPQAGESSAQDPAPQQASERE